MHLTIFLLFFLLNLAYLSCTSSLDKNISSRSSQPVLSFYYRALNSIEKNRLDKAISFLDSAININSDFAQLYFTKAQILELKNAPDSAISQYEISLSKKSYYPELWINLSELYMQKSRFADAASLYRRLTETYPDSMVYQLKLAEAYLYNEQASLALERINYFQSRGGTSDEVNRLKGLSFYQRNEFEKSIPFLENYAAVYPNNLEVQKSLGGALLKVGILEKGISHINRALDLNSADPGLYLYRAQYFEARDKMDMAREQLKFALKLDSTNVEVLQACGIFFLNQKDTMQAYNYLEKAISLKPDCYQCLKLLGILEEAKKNYANAIFYLEKYLKNTYIKDEKIELLVRRLREMERLN